MRFAWILLLTVVGHLQFVANQSLLSKKASALRCQRPKDGEQWCVCGKAKTKYDLLQGQRCVNGHVLDQPDETNRKRYNRGLRIPLKPIDQSARGGNNGLGNSKLIFKRPSGGIDEGFVPLRKVSVEAWIDTFAADVTLTQVYFNQEETPIEAIYVFPVEENAAVYAFTATIDNRTITAVLKEKDLAESEYKMAVSQGRTAVLMQQSKQTFDTFKVSVGSLPPGKECQITIQYVTELDLVEGDSIRFVVPTTIAPRYNPSQGSTQSPDDTKTEYVQNTSYSMWFRAHVSRGDDLKIMQVANQSHPVNVSVSRKFIDVSAGPIDLDRDIILDVDLPRSRAVTVSSMEKHPNSSNHAVLLSFAPRLSDFMKIVPDSNDSNSEFIFIVDCSGSMTSDDGIGLAREAMLLFIRSLPVDSQFNIIRFGSHFDVLFKNETITTVYDEKTAKIAEDMTRSMQADFGGTELLEPLQHLQKHPPVVGRSRQIFLLTDGEVSNTNEVIDLCRQMSSTTRIFSFGLGYSPSRSLVKGLARATNGYFVFVPPKTKVDTYVGSQLARALQPSLTNVRLEWHGATTNQSQSPKTIPPLYINDRVLLYEFLENVPKKHNITVDVLVGDRRLTTIKLPSYVGEKHSTIRRLAAKALLQELQHDKQSTGVEGETTLKQRITALSLEHQILCPHTAFVGVETDGPIRNHTLSNVRYVPIQISKDSEQRPMPQAMGYGYYMSAPRGNAGPLAMAQSRAYGPPGPQFHGYSILGQRQPQHSFSSMNFNEMSHNSDQADSAEEASTRSSSLLTADPVRWLIDQQSFNGAWALSDQEVEALTNGKSLDTIQSTVTKDKKNLCTGLVITLLESKYAAQKNLWFAIAEKGRKQLQRSGLSVLEINLLIDEIKKQL